jgi:hypothetical protein
MHKSISLKVFMKKSFIAIGNFKSSQPTTNQDTVSEQREDDL